MPEQSSCELQRWTPELSDQAKLTALLADCKFLKVIDGSAREAVINWGVTLAEARRTVLSGLGEPRQLAQIYDAWISGKTALAKVIVRRRMLDLFSDDARRPNHNSLPDVDHAGLGGFAADPQANPLERLLAAQTIEAALAALACFAAIGGRQREQAELVRRRFIEEAPYAQLSTELGCTQNALRVRLFKALEALRKHIAKDHPELTPGDAVRRRRGGPGRRRRAS